MRKHIISSSTWRLSIIAIFSVSVIPGLLSSITAYAIVIDPILLISDTHNRLSGNKNLTEQDVLLPHIYNNSKNSVVSITTKIHPSLLDSGVRNSNGALDIPIGTGSGFVYDNEGHIITNYHVLKGGTSVDVRFLDGNSYSANLVGKDPYTDLAVLQINSSAFYQQDFAPLPLGDSSSLDVGQHVIAIGNPLGYSGTMTEGIISQLDLVLADPETGYNSGIIQFDAPITYGNSGGPLLNLDGEVIGVTSAGAADEERLISFINFAIPSDKVAEIVPQLISTGSYKHVWLGISGIDITPDLAQTMELNNATGIIAYYVVPGSPADIAGISSGTDTDRINLYGEDTGINSNADVIIGIDDKQIRQMADLLNIIDAKSPGDTVTLKIIRNGNIHNVVVQLSERLVET